eukprot:scaffold1384_cov256-Pinguiococcus_pyrenoidosus.AAC.16
MVYFKHLGGEAAHTSRSAARCGLEDGAPPDVLRAGLCHGVEGGLHAVARLGRSLEVRQQSWVALQDALYHVVTLLSIRSGQRVLLRQVLLVPDEPRPCHAAETPRVRAIVHKQHAVGAAEVARGYRAKALLPRRVPELQLDVLAGGVGEGADLQVHPDGGDEALAVAVVSKALHDGALAHAAVSNEQQLV